MSLSDIAKKSHSPNFDAISPDFTMPCRLDFLRTFAGNRFSPRVRAAFSGRRHHFFRSNLFRIPRRPAGVALYRVLVFANAGSASCHGGRKRTTIDSRMNGRTSRQPAANKPSLAKTGG